MREKEMRCSKTKNKDSNNMWVRLKLDGQERQWEDNMEKEKREDETDMYKHKKMERDREQAYERSGVERVRGKIERVCVWRRKLYEPKRITVEREEVCERVYVIKKWCV
jgi:hypothetical protein